MAGLLATRIAVNLDAEARAHVRYLAGRPTDLSGAIDFAGRALDEAPFAAGRGVADVIGNGSDNFGQTPEASHDALVQRGVTVNGLVLDGDARVLADYGGSVVGGPGAFLLAAEAEAHLGEVPESPHRNRGRQPAAAMIGPKSAALSEAPPTSPPSTLGTAKISAAFDALTEPP